MMHIRVAEVHRILPGADSRVIYSAVETVAVEHEQADNFIIEVWSLVEVETGGVKDQ